MDETMNVVAERLADQFAHLPITTIIRVLTDYVTDHPQAPPPEVEQATQTALSKIPADREAR